MGAYDRAAFRDGKADRALRISELRQQIATREETIEEWKQLQIDAMEDDEVSLARSIGQSIMALRQETEAMWGQFRQEVKS